MKEDWKTKIRLDYKDIISEAQIEATINYWQEFIDDTIHQTREKTLEEVENMIGEKTIKAGEFYRGVNEFRNQMLLTLNKLKHEQED